MGPATIGYSKNFLASAMATNSTDTIVLIIFLLTMYFFAFEEFFINSLSSLIDLL